MEGPGVDLFKPQRLSAEALKAGLEHVLDANLAADGRRTIFAAANHHVGIEHPGLTITKSNQLRRSYR